MAGTLQGLKNCDMMQNAMKWLDANSAAYGYFRRWCGGRAQCLSYQMIAELRTHEHVVSVVRPTPEAFAAQYRS